VGHFKVIVHTFYVILFALIWLPLPAAAVSQAQGETTAVSPTFYSDVSYTFGQSMTFVLEAEGLDLADVTEVILFFRSEAATSTYSAELPMTGAAWPLSHRVDLTSVRLPPFVDVAYWWRVTLVDGAVVEVPSQTTAYVDDQFEWQTLTQNGVTAHWVGDDLALGQLALDIVAESLPRLRQLLPAPEPVEFDLYLYPTSADLRAALRLTGQEWVGGHAHPELGVLLVTAVNIRTAPTDLRQSIPHEMTHLFLYQATGPNYDRVPQWFNEGLATYMEASPNPSYDLLLREAVNGRVTMPLADLCHSFPDREEQTLLAYAQSASVIRYIQTRYGNQALRGLVNAFADGADCYSGVERALGLTLDDFNRDWLRSLEPRSPLAQFWQESGLWLLLLVGGFLFAGLLVWLPRRV
jgi:hypothetical protein